MSIYEWIESRVPGGHGSAFGRLLDVAYTEEYGAETTDQSSLNLVYLLGYQPEPERASRSSASPTSGSTSRAGTSGCPRRSRPTLPDVRLGWRMTSRSRGTATGRVALAFETAGGLDHRDRGRGDPDAAVHRCCARSTTRGAGFDARKRRAIAELGAGSEREAPAPVHEPPTGTRAARGGSRTATRTPTSATRTRGT